MYTYMKGLLLYLLHFCPPSLPSQNRHQFRGECFTIIYYPELQVDVKCAPKKRISLIKLPSNHWMQSNELASSTCSAHDTHVEVSKTIKLFIEPLQFANLLELHKEIYSRFGGSALVTSTFYFRKYPGNRLKYSNRDN